MTFILALIQKLSGLFASPFLPMDSDYSYRARSLEAVRVRNSHYTPYRTPRDWRD